MIKIKSQVNPKMLQNFSHETYPDISIVTETSKLNLVLAYLSIDSAYFSSLESDMLEVNLKHLPEKAVVQVLRALYGDELIAYSINQLEDIYRVISELGIDDYKQSIEKEITNSKELIQSLQILQFCFKNDLMLEYLKQYHFQNNLRALEDNRNFLQLSKISLDTLIPLLVEYHAFANDKANATINNIMENYFNRNNIRATDFFKEYEVEPLMIIWQKFHHTLQIYDRKLSKVKSTESFDSQQMTNAFVPKRSSLNMPTKKEEKAILQEKDKRIEHLINQISTKDRMIEKLSKQLQEIRRAKGLTVQSSRRVPSFPLLPEEDEEISILMGVKNSKKQLPNKGKTQLPEAKKVQIAFEKSPKEAKHKPFTYHKITRP